MTVVACHPVRFGLGLIAQNNEPARGRGDRRKSTPSNARQHSSAQCWTHLRSCGVHTALQDVGLQLTPERASRSSACRPNSVEVYSKLSHDLSGIAQGEGYAFEYAANHMSSTVT